MGTVAIGEVAYHQGTGIIGRGRSDEIRKETGIVAVYFGNLDGTYSLYGSARREM